VVEAATPQRKAKSCLPLSIDTMPWTRNVKYEAKQVPGIRF
jgi:hypothetical protein